MCLFFDLLGDFVLLVVGVVVVVGCLPNVGGLFTDVFISIVLRFGCSCCYVLLIVFCFAFAVCVWGLLTVFTLR